MIGTEDLKKPSDMVNEPIFEKFTTFLKNYTVSLPKDKGKQVELLKAMKESVY